MTANAVPPTTAATHDRRGRRVPWSQWLQELTEYLNVYGKYPQNGTVLGSWVSRQRTAYKRGILPGVQVSQLEALPGWLWNARKDPWPANFDRLQAHLAQHGNIPRTGAVGDWVTRQRTAYASGQLSAGRAELLEVLPGWSWETTMWGRSFSEYAAHLEEAGRAPARGTSLYRWARRQRNLYAAGRLTVAQIGQLEGLPDWTWNRREESWQQHYKGVATTLSARGSYPRSGSSLGIWIEGQRRAYRQGRLSKERIALLETLSGWRWRKPSWDEHYAELSRYVAESGRLPRRSTKLSYWIRTQQAAYHESRLSADQICRLENLTGWTWAPALNARSAAA